MQAFWNQGTKNEEKDFPACIGLQKINIDLPDLPCLKKKNSVLNSLSFNSSHWAPHINPDF